MSLSDRLQIRRPRIVVLYVDTGWYYGLDGGEPVPTDVLHEIGENGCARHHAQAGVRSGGLCQRAR